MTPVPKCLHVGIISLSSSLYNALCWFCIEMKGVRPLCKAYSVGVSQEDVLRNRSRAGQGRLTLHELELPRPAAAHPDVPHPSGLNDVVQRAHRLFDRSVVVESVALEDIDVVELQSGQRVLDRGEDSLSGISPVVTSKDHPHLSGQPPVVGPSSGTFVLEFTIGVVRLGEDHDALTGDIVFLEKLAKDHLALPCRVDVGSVKSLRVSLEQANTQKANSR